MMVQFYKSIFLSAVQSFLVGCVLKQVFCFAASVISCTFIVQIRCVAMIYDAFYWSLEKSAIQEIIRTTPAPMTKEEMIIISTRHRNRTKPKTSKYQHDFQGFIYIYLCNGIPLLKIMESNGIPLFEVTLYGYFSQLSLKQTNMRFT